MTQFAGLLNDLPLAPDADLTEMIQFLMQQVAEIFQTTQQTVEENCERIAAEVAEYRSLEDSPHLRTRLSRLVSIQRDYLDPVIRILDVNGELHDLTEQVSSCCIRLEAPLAHTSGPISEEAAMLRREIVWLHRVTIRRAEEARRELGPLCEAAARESKISVGVNRALERIASRDWYWLRLEEALPEPSVPNRNWRSCELPGRRWTKVSNFAAGRKKFSMVFGRLNRRFAKKPIAAETGLRLIPTALILQSSNNVRKRSGRINHRDAGADR